ncbi:MAG: tRNA 2-thiouridine(34) synthase MnmA [Candidatus Aminicenantes bacterium]|nr:tRNA 2-thiouridine(34) synthase MnmA [Candidatus Aminicenantes bacterium]
MRLNDDGRVIVAMSGGVDSSVAAALLVEAGRDVAGITMDLFAPGEWTGRAKEAVAGLERNAARDAARVAAALGIRHVTVDLHAAFERAVVSDFCREYARGRTPNPCVRCNRLVKFDLLWRKARRLGAVRLATGHHARVAYDRSRRRVLLKKGLDAAKDQSYFLYGLTQDQLSRTLFPVGGLTKAEVRRAAARLGLGRGLAARPESQEVCFIPGRDYARFLGERIPDAFRPGPIVDRRGQTIGTHQGIIHFTVGQRRGMGVSGPHAYYVVSLDPDTNTVVLGRDEDLRRRRIRVVDVNWIANEKLTRTRRAFVKIRYRHREAAARIRPLAGGEVIVEFETPQRAVTPGQAAVFYDGDVVLGGGTIEAALDENGS